MVWVDYLILIVILASVAFGIWRGFVKEALSLAAWVVGFMVALWHWNALARWFERWIDSPGVAAALAFGVLLFGVLVLGAVINHFVAKGVAKVGLKAVDRTFGALFGLARGIALVAALLLGAGLLHADRTDSWRNAKLVPYFAPAVTWLRGHLDTSPEFGPRRF